MGDRRLPRPIAQLPQTVRVIEDLVHPIGQFGSGKEID
jgi:hypothetical protein